MISLKNKDIIYWPNSRNIQLLIRNRNVYSITFSRKKKLSLWSTCIIASRSFWLDIVLWETKIKFSLFIQHNYLAEIFTGWYQKYFFLWKSPKNYQKKCFKAKYIWPSKPKVKTRQIRQHLWAKNGKKGRYTIISNKATFFE